MTSPLRTIAGSLIPSLLRRSLFSTSQSFDLLSSSPNPNPDNDHNHLHECNPSKIELDYQHTDVVWEDGHSSSFLNAWLRDHCQCADCYDQTTAQRSSDTLALGPSSRVRSTQATTTSDGKLTVRIEYGDECGECDESSKNTKRSSHECVFPLHWLRKHCYSSSGQEHRRQKGHLQRYVWDSKELQQLCVENNDSNSASLLLAGLPATPLRDLASKPGVLRDQLTRYGIAFVSDIEVPSGEQSVDKCKQIVHDTVRDYIGYPRETLWGNLWDTAVSEDASDTAYTNIALRPHVDCTYLRDPPELQVFLCAAESEDATGGSSTFVDGFKVAEEIYNRSPEAFHFFCTTQLGFQCIQDGVNSVAYGTVFETDPGVSHPTPQDTRRFRYNNDDRSVLHYLSAKDVAKFYDYVPLLLELLRDDQYVLRTRLQKGTMAIVNNHRVLHGRDSFVGTGRNLVGCYAEMSESVLPYAVSAPIPPPNNQL